MLSITPMNDNSSTRSGKLDLARALNAVKALIDNPDDTAQAFAVVDALAGSTPERNMRRFRATEVGRRVLGQRRSLLAALSDRERLEALDEGTLGRAYLRFMQEEGITADGLVEASVEGADRARDAFLARDEREVFESWMRDSHDLWHTVTGYKGDLIGEASLLAFSFAQTRHPGVGLIVLAALVRTTFIGRAFGPARAHEPLDVDTRRVRRMILRGLWRGLRAGWLVEQDWEALLEQPLSEVRAKLNLGEAPVYTPIRTGEMMPHAPAAA